MIREGSVLAELFVPDLDELVAVLSRKAKVLVIGDIRRTAMGVRQWQPSVPRHLGGKDVVVAVQATVNAAHVIACQYRYSCTTMPRYQDFPT